MRTAGRLSRANALSTPCAVMCTPSPQPCGRTDPHVLGPNAKRATQWPCKRTTDAAVSDRSVVKHLIFQAPSYERNDHEPWAILCLHRQDSEIGKHSVNPRLVSGVPRREPAVQRAEGPLLTGFIGSVNLRCGGGSRGAHDMQGDGHPPGQFLILGRRQSPTPSGSVPEDIP